MSSFEVIIGGMGVNVSSPEAAQAAGRYSQATGRGILPVVSGTGAAVLLGRILQAGDERADRYMNIIRELPASVWERIERRYYHAPKRKSTISTPVPSTNNPLFLALTVAGTYALVRLSKEGHDQPTGMNILEKIQISHPAEIYGAMLAGVDYLLMGAGMPFDMPSLLTQLANGQPGEYPIHVNGGEPGMAKVVFDPTCLGLELKPLKKPEFIPIISSDTLAKMVAKRIGSEIYGFVVEFHTAGGHNAMARGKRLDEHGSPIYGEKDRIDFAAIRELGIRFWLAGGQSSPEGLAQAQAEGAEGIQVGGIIALADESGMDHDAKSDLRRKAYMGELEVRPRMISPSGFPIQTVSDERSVANPDVFDDRVRSCTVGCLRQAYVSAKSPDHYVWACPAEPIADFVAKTGKEPPADQRCVCQGLLTTAGLPDVRADGYQEPAFITFGQEYGFVKKLMNGPDDQYTVADALDYILS